MRFVYAHFPVNAIIEDGGNVIHIKNFLGEKITRAVRMLDGVTVKRSDNVKDEITLEGNSVENVSQSGTHRYLGRDGVRCVVQCDVW